MGVFQAIDRFEGRSSLKTWIFRILVNRAKTHAQRERRMVPFSQLVRREVDTSELAVDPDRFQTPDEEWPGHWSLPPQSWGEDAEKRLLAEETLEQIQRAIDALPQAQRMVITLRDVQGWASEEVCNVLDISETNQRVLLHRGRSKVRRAVEKYFTER
jgi:RNA polymerase sigma-70 factor (ECF subfamily)